MNANLKADTTDVLLNRKRAMHVAAFQYRIDEIADKLQARGTLLCSGAHVCGKGIEGQGMTGASLTPGLRNRPLTAGMF